MIPIRRMGAALLVLSLALFAGCATGPQYDNTPPPMTVAQMLAAPVCTDLPLDQTPNINITAGWVKEKMQCGSKYASGSWSCADASKCQPIVYATTFGEKDRGKTMHLAVDGWGSFAACAEPAFRIGYHNIDCKPIEFTGDRIRAILEATVPPLSPGAGEQTAPVLQVTIWPRGPGKIIVGQIGRVETPAQ